MCMSWTFSVVMASLVSVVVAADEPATASRDFEVKAGPHHRRKTAVTVALPESLAARRAFTLEDLDAKKPVPVQLLPESGVGRAVVFLLDDLKSGTSRRFRLSASSRANDDDTACVCTDDGKSLNLKVEGRTVLSYHHTVVEPPLGMDALYRRSGYIHPLLTPSGKEVTGDFAPDHAHQHAMFFAWVNTTYAGRKVDFWNQQNRTGRVRALDVLDMQSGPVFTSFTVRQRHEDLTASDSPAPVLNETWTVRAYKTDPVSGMFLLDFSSTQTCAGLTSLQVNKYHYGGFGIRGNSAWFDPAAKGDDLPDPAKSGESEFLTSEGKYRADGNHTRPRWVDLTGKVNGAFAGVTVLDAPSNFRFPQPVRLHPNKPYFCFAPMVEGPFTIEPGKPYLSQYRVISHDGSPDVKIIERLWNDLAEPPSVTFMRE